MVLRGTLADIAEKVEVAGLKHTAVILVGRALGVRDTPDVACSHLYDPARDRLT
jgi:precorrin-4/cobalt-precorrin-4 C11-methyltransferase